MPAPPPSSGKMEFIYTRLFGLRFPGGERALRYEIRLEREPPFCQNSEIIEEGKQIFCFKSIHIKLGEELKSVIQRTLGGQTEYSMFVMAVKEPRSSGWGGA